VIRVVRIIRVVSSDIRVIMVFRNIAIRTGKLYLKAQIRLGKKCKTGNKKDAKGKPTLTQEFRMMMKSHALPAGLAACAPVFNDKI
jgi:hypothetical protein